MAPTDQTAETAAFAALAACASRCGYTLTDWELTIYRKEMQRLGWPRVAKALEEIYCGLGGGRRFDMPSINDLKERCGETPVGDKAIATDVAGRILGAVVRYGDQFTRADEEVVYRAQAYVGELGWAVVTRVFGSWPACTDTYTRDNHAHLHAQLRDAALGAIEMARKGAITMAPSLPPAGAIAINKPKG